MFVSFVIELSHALFEFKSVSVYLIHYLLQIALRLP